MPTIKVGRFELSEDGTLSGPAEYMRQQGNAKLDSILAGNDVGFNTVAHLSPSLETAILVALQTDYAGWAGLQQALGWTKRGSR